MKAYLAIMGKKSYWSTIYFDGFAGSGNRENRDVVQEDSLYNKLFQDEQSKEENLIYRGAAERVLMLDKKFDYYYFVDTNLQSLDSLKAKLAPYSHDVNVVFRHDNANNQLCKLADRMITTPKKYVALVFLDPFAMEVNWDSIEKLRGTRTDLWILVPTGTIINRLLCRNGDLLAPDRLTDFFGMTEQEIKEVFYTREKRATLFGEDETIQKIPNSITKIAELYIRRLKTIWKYTTERPLTLYNTKNVPIFHLVFASNNKTATKIALQIVDSI